MAQVRSIERESPEALREVLIDAGLFLVAYELIRSLVVRPVELFYADTTFGEGMAFKTFEDDVSSRAKHKFDACLLWLRDLMKGISDDQYHAIHRVREYRDELTHGIHEKLAEYDFAKATALPLDAKDALFALDNFWVLMEISADPEFSHIENWDEIYSNPYSMLKTLLTNVRPTG